MNPTDPLISVDSISKRFPGVTALDQVSLTLGKREILAVIGENGAGKSTLMKILAGIQPPDEGQIILDGAPVSIPSVQRAQSLGIALIHQEISLCQNLDVGANIFLGREPRRFGLIDQNQIRQSSATALKQVGLDVSPSTIVRNLSIGQQQMVEIAKAVSSDARILIMDEPTSSLSLQESENLFTIVRGLQSQGVSVIYISHRLGEVELLADRVVVLRDGKNAGELSGTEINHDAMVKRMVGRDVPKFTPRPTRDTDKIVFRADNLRTPANPDCDINFQIHAGEIVGIAGLVGAGRTELLTTIFGITPAIAGTTFVNDKPIDISNCRIAIGQQIGLIPEDRKLQGIILEMSVAKNISLATVRQSRRMGLIDFNRDRRLGDQMRQRLKIKTPTLDLAVNFLSGGNQQKVVIAKWIALRPKILLMDEPTRGVDVGAKQEIYRLIRELADSGVAILFASSDMEEVLSLSDRMIVMHQGHIAGELPKPEFSEQAVMSLATGVTETSGELIR